jgi:hypothetical protein
MYSNGLKHTEVLTAMLGRLGWRQGTITVPTLSSDNLTSDSGRYFNDFHSLVTVKNIIDTVEDSSISDTDFNTYLQDIQKGVISETLNKVFSPQYFDSPKSLFERFNTTSTTQNNTGLFVGYKIRPAADNHITVQVNSLQLLFDGAATFNIYLFHERKAAPLKIQSVTTVANDTVEVDLVDWYLSHSDLPGCYYIGYFQDDLGTVKAINENAEWNLNAFCFQYESVFTNVLDTERIDRNNYGGLGTTSGLNLELSSFADRTKKIMRNISLFDNAIGYGMAVKVLEGIIYSTNRSNGNERALKEVIAEATYDLTGTLPIAGTAKKRSLRDEYNDSLNELCQAFNPNPKAQTINLC